MNNFLIRSQSKPRQPELLCQKCKTPVRLAYSSSYFQFVNPATGRRERICVDCMMQGYLAAQQPKGGGIYPRITQKLFKFIYRLTAAVRV
jgi:hypothetical protein